MVGHSPMAGANEDSGTTELGLDLVYALLADRRRRLALASLGDHSESMALADLTREVAARERGSPVAEIPRGAVEDVYSSLYHTHLPKLEEAGIVEYDPDDDRVRESAAAERVQRVRTFGAKGERRGQ